MTEMLHHASLVCPRCGRRDESTILGLRCPLDGWAYVHPETLERLRDDPMLGRVLAGKYLLVDLIGAGGMGAVYLSLQEALGREVAVKVLRTTTGTGDPELRGRFFREARMLGKLQHRHIVTVHDHGEEPDGTLFMVMERLRGKSLRQTLSEETRLHPGRAREIALQVLDALSEAHEQCMVHRDLKPDNIMLVPERTGEPAAKVLDFGIVRVLGSDEPESAPKTRQGIALGTPAYMAPEQVQGKPITPSTDLYAVGILLFEMVVGRPPFVGESAWETVTRHVTTPVPPIPPGLGIPVAYEQLVRRALEKDPAERFRTAADMAAALRLIVIQPGTARFVPVELAETAALGVQSPTTSTALAGERVATGEVARRRPMPMMLAVFIAAIAVGLGTLWFWPASSADADSVHAWQAPPVPLPPGRSDPPEVASAAPTAPPTSAPALPPSVAPSATPSAFPPAVVRPQSPSVELRPRPVQLPEGRAPKEAKPPVVKPTPPSAPATSSSLEAL